jgi:hypothetical protein
LVYRSCTKKIDMYCSKISVRSVYQFIEWFLLVLKIGTVSIFQSLDQTMECCAHIPLNCAMLGPRSASQVDERIHRKWRGDKKLEGDREDKE